MAKYTFRIHQVDRVKGDSDGWLKSEGLTNDNITNIPDAMEVVPASGKIGTSIPTPLARIYLFKTAYKVLNDAYEKSKNNNSNKDVKKFGSYAQLVSDSLDILQLLFEKGNDPSLKFIKWHKDGVIQNLKNKGTDSGILLGESLEMAFNTARAFDSEMTLIEYNGLLLGGLSPFTLVYTSPNLRRDLAERRKSGKFDFSSNKKVDFCGVKPVSLSERPKEFQEFLYSLTLIHKSMLQAGNSFMDFGRYILNQLGDYYMTETDTFVQEFENNYKEFKTPLEVAGIKLRWNNRVPDLENSSHFIMAPTSTEYKKYMSVVPLVLPEKFTQQGWKYVDEYWDTNTQILSSMCADQGTGTYKGKQIGDRYLPKNGGHNGEYSTIRYPWVSNSDFFYDNIIDLGYAINAEKYFNNATSNANNGAVSFLLPIRREYFLFFKITDLKDNLKMVAVYDDPNDMASLKEVRAELTIKLKGDKKITLSRTYNSSDIYSNAPMGLGIFPFYQLHKESNLKNEYSVYLFEQSKKASLSFFADSQLDTRLEINGVPRSSLNAGSSTIYSLRNTTSNKFDFIEVKVNASSESSYSALIVPLWKVYNQDHNDRQANKTMISLDFGTSNTHIAYYNPDSKNIESFSIGADDMQMVLLNKPMQNVRSGKIDYRSKKSFGRAEAMADFLREFAPSVIGKESIQGIAYPVKTASLNSPKLYDAAVANPFETVNIGYDINNESVQLDSNFEYATNLKWAAQEARRLGGGAAEGGIESKRIYAYCEQTLWMLKNMIVNKGYYAGKIDMVYFYPASMESQDQKMFKNAWEAAVKRIFTDCGFAVDLKEPELESVAPYYSLLNKVDSSTRLFAYNSINIDIGGGTTDVFILDKQYRDPETQKSVTYGYEASVQFAGDNIWGTTKPVGNMRNGFVQFMETLIDKKEVKLHPDLMQRYTLFKARTKNSSEGDKDMAAFFFKYADEFKFADRISNNRHLKKVLLLHYASIINYVADIIKYIKSIRPEFEVPSTLTFTGKGSEYIKIISSDERVIERLTYVLFNAFGISKDEFKHGFKVAYTDNPKILTAEGGIHRYKNPNISLTFVAKDTVFIPNQDDDNITRDSAFFEMVGESVLGFKTEKDVDYMANKVLTYKGAVMTHFNEFIDAIYENRQIISSVLSDISFETKDVQKIKEKASESYDTLGQLFEKGHSTEEPILKSNLFFLAVANMLVEYSNVQNN